jgi:hypothetical protein
MISKSSACLEIGAILSSILISTFYCIYFIRVRGDSLEMEQNLTHNSYDFLDICNNTYNILDKDPFKEISMITPVSLCLIVLFTILNNCKQHREANVAAVVKKSLLNFNLPPIYNIFLKKDRLHVSIAFCILSYELFTISLQRIIDTFENETPTLGYCILSVLYEIIDVFIIACRYFPIFIALAFDNLLVRLLASLFLYLDILVSFYDYAICLKKDFYSEIDRPLINFILFMLNFPSVAFSAYIAFHLCFKTIVRKVIRTEKIQPVVGLNSSFNKLLFLANNQNLFFTAEDLKYSQSVLKKQSITRSVHYDGGLESKKSSSVLGFMKSKVSGYIRSIYDPNFYFNYSLRFMSTQMVNLFANIYQILYLIYQYRVLFDGLFKEYPSEASMQITLLQSNSIFNYTSGIVYCNVFQIVPCSSDGQLIAAVPPTRQLDVYAWSWITFYMCLIVPILTISFHFVENFRNYKRDLIQICKGKRNFKDKHKLYAKREIAVI